MNDLGAIILAGGRSQRMGRDKAALLWAGQTAAARLVELARAVGAAEVVVAGGDYGLPFVRDAIDHAGPIGGVMAGLASLPAARRLLVLAVDAPTLTPEDLQPLLEAPPPGAAYAGLPLPMVFLRHAAPAEIASDTPLRRFVALVGLHELAPPAAAQLRLRGANTPAELAALRRQDPFIEAAQ